jgi:hypothetical protein
MKKKVLALMLAALMIAAMAPTAVFAAVGDATTITLKLGGADKVIATSDITDPSNNSGAVNGPTAGNLILTSAQLTALNAATGATVISSDGTTSAVLWVSLGSSYAATSLIQDDAGTAAPAASDIISGKTFADTALSTAVFDDYIAFLVLNGATDGEVYDMAVVKLVQAGSSLPSGSISGDSTVTYEDFSAIYDVTVPTDAMLDFSVDPQGLLDIADSTSIPFEDLAVLGAIVGSPTATTLINNSAKATKATVSLKGTGDATFVNYTTDDATTLAAVTSNNTANLLLYAAPSSTAVKTIATEYTKSRYGYVVGQSAETTLSFVLQPANWTVARSGSTYTASPTAGTGDGTGFTLGGYANGKANWSDYTGGGATKNVGVTVTYAFEDATAAELLTSEADAIAANGTGSYTDGTHYYSRQDGVHDCITKAAAKALTLTTPVITPGWTGAAIPAGGSTALVSEVVTVTKSSYPSGTNYEVPFDLAGKTPTNVRMASGTLPATDYTVSGGKLYLNGSKITAQGAGAGKQLFFTVEGTEYTFSYTLNA